MRGIVAALVVVVAYHGVAHAQPGAVAPQPYIPVQLSPEDQELLSAGEISDGRHVGGAVACLVLGFGIGQAVQGRYTDTGWIFTVGEIGSGVAVIAGLGSVLGGCDFEENCHYNSNRNGRALLLGGAIALVGFRTWEIVDVIMGPSRHNQRLRALRERLGLPPPMYSTTLRPYVAPTLSRDGATTAGISLRF